MMTTIGRMMAPQQRMEQLRSNRGYLQADASGRRRMEKAVSMGLPMTANPEAWAPFDGQLGPDGQLRPMRYALPPSGWGRGWGSVGINREPKSTGRIQSGAPLGSAGSSGYDLARGMRGGPQPVESAPMPSGGSSLSFTGFGGMMREQEEEMNRGLGSLVGFGGIPRFPFAGSY